VNSIRIKSVALSAIFASLTGLSIGTSFSKLGFANCPELSAAQLLENLPEQIEQRRLTYFADENNHFSDPAVETTAKFLVDTRGWFGEKATSSPLRYLLTMSEMQALAKSPEACQQLAARLKSDHQLYTDLGAFGDREHLEGSKLHMISAILVEYDLIRQKPGTGPYDQASFEELASRIGLEPKNFERGYRLDSRPPNEILKEGGFMPNPSKPRGSMTEHSLPNKTLVFSSQGSNFVSTSTKEGNEFNLKIYPVFSSAREPTSKEVPAFESNGPSKVLETWEYQISNYQAVVPHASSRIEGEAEVVTNSIPAQKITHARRIFLQVKLNSDGQPSSLLNSQIGEWRPLSAFAQ
jgi:hypothetical protein